MSKIWLPLVLAGLLGLTTACDTISAGTGIAETKGVQAIENKKRVNDAQARFVLVAPCDMSVGAYHRVLNDVEQRAVDWLCEGDIVTDDDVEFLRDYIELLERSRAAVNDETPE